MSGTLDLRGGATWMPMGWVFDNALRAMSTALRASDASLAETLLRSRTEVSGGYLDLRGLGTDRFRALIDATVQAYEDALRSGPGAFFVPSAYADYMRAFSTLKALLRSDGRASSPGLPVGTLLVGDTTSWTAEWWVFDHLLEQAAAQLRAEDDVLSEALIRARVENGIGRGSLRDISTDRFVSVLRAAEFIRVRQRHAPETFAPAFEAVVRPPTDDLVRILSSDERATGGAGSVTPGASMQGGPSPIGVDPITGAPRPLEATAARDLEETLARRKRERRMRLTRSSLQLSIGSRSIVVGGEAYLSGHTSPDFVVYSNTIVRWDDGTPVSDDERRAVIQEILRQAAREHFQIEIE